jgi:hypothetical protein
MGGKRDGGTGQVRRKMRGENFELETIYSSVCDRLFTGSCVKMNTGLTLSPSNSEIHINLNTGSEAYM